MSHATFELVCALCQTLLQPAHPAPWTDALWVAEQQALIAAAQEAPAPEALPAPLVRAAPSLGARRSFADGRTLQVNLTPTPARCAPWVALTF
ncbi:MAG: hypothetical protein ABW252_05570 [Polyangiales bacterium]